MKGNSTTRHPRNAAMNSSKPIMELIPNTYSDGVLLWVDVGCLVCTETAFVYTVKCTGHPCMPDQCFLCTGTPYMFHLSRVSITRAQKHTSLSSTCDRTCVPLLVGLLFLHMFYSRLLPRTCLPLLVGLIRCSRRLLRTFVPPLRWFVLQQRHLLETVASQNMEKAPPVQMLCTREAVRKQEV